MTFHLHKQKDFKVQEGGDRMLVDREDYELNYDLVGYSMYGFIRLCLVNTLGYVYGLRDESLT